MKRKLLFLLLCMTTAMNAQTIVKGDMNDDGQVTIADVTSVVNVAVGRAPMETLNVGTSGNPYEVDNSMVVGTWYATDGSHFNLNADGTTDFPNGATYEFMPMHGHLLIYDATGLPSRVLPLIKVTTEYLLAVDYGTGTFTYYTNSSFMVSGLTLSQSSLTLTPQATAQLTVTVTPSNALNSNVVWSSSNENVATVNNTGLVTAVASGNCTITATATDGSGMTATCQVTVSQSVTSIMLNHTSLSIAPDQAQRLTATMLPADAANTTVAWTSNNENVATVSSAGWVFAVGTGTCTITCTAQDGSGVTATCEVTVWEMVLSQTTLNLALDEYKKLTATANPSNFTLPALTWSSSDNNVAEVTSTGLVCAIGPGTCTITATAQDGSGVSATCTVTVANPDTHEYVDLGLPSGTLWATCNIGADNPEDYGDYFAWGETTAKSTYSEDTYTYSGNPTELPTSADVAYVTWGSNWRMPSLAQFLELINSSYTTTTWTTLNGFYGRLITSKLNGNSIFLPAAGYRNDSSLIYGGAHGYYWSRALSTSDTSYACSLYFTSGGIGADYFYRYLGRSVRPVRNITQ